MNKVTSYVWPCPSCGQTTNYFEDDTGRAWANCRNCGWQREAAPVLGRNGKPVVGKDGRWAYRVSERQVTLHNLDDKARVAFQLLPDMRPARDDSRLVRWFKKLKAGLHNLSLPGVERGVPGKARPNLAGWLLEWVKKWTK